MTLQLPDLPHVPDPSGDYGWGIEHLTAWRHRERILADWRIRDTHEQAVASLRRDAELAEALAQRDGRLRALDPEPPTMRIPRAAMDAAIEFAADHQAPEGPRFTWPTSWPAELAATGNALERGERYVRWGLGKGAESQPSVGNVNGVLGTSNYVRSAQIAQWADAWSAGTHS